MAGIVNIAATSGARHLSHTFGLAVTFALSTNLTQYVAWKSSIRIGSHWNRHGPTYLLALSVPLTAVDYVRHAILDNHMPVAKHLSMYKHGTSMQYGLPDFSRLSIVGWTITIGCTYLGYILMIVGIVWAAGLRRKIGDAYRQIRKAQKEARNRTQTTTTIPEEDPLLEHPIEDSEV